MSFSLFALAIYILIIGFLLLSSLKLARGQIRLCSYKSKSLKKHWQVFIIQGVISFLILLIGLYLKDHWLIHLRILYWPMLCWGPLAFILSLCGFIFDIARIVPEKKPMSALAAEIDPVTPGI